MFLCHLMLRKQVLVIKLVKALMDTVDTVQPPQQYININENQYIHYTHVLTLDPVQKKKVLNSMVPYNYNYNNRKVSHVIYQGCFKLNLILHF